jgi:hypothetical protein
MRTAAGVSLLLACLGVAACGERRLECGNPDVTSTLSSMVRERLLRVMEDADPAAFDAARRAALAHRTQVSPQAARLVEWDAISGRLTCVALIVVDAPGSRPDADGSRGIELRYRVTRDDDDTFFVEVGYVEMMSLFPVRSVPGRRIPSRN